MVLYLQLSGLGDVLSQMPTDEAARLFDCIHAPSTPMPSRAPCLQSLDTRVHVQWTALYYEAPSFVATIST